MDLRAKKWQRKQSGTRNGREEAISPTNPLREAKFKKRQAKWDKWLKILDNKQGKGEWYGWGLWI